MFCRAVPYCGGEKYIFASYSHKDEEKVYPVLERLAEEGFRIWYDEGIAAGSEWPETIARELEGSELCVVFISPDYVNSHNCRKETNFAILRNKPLITVFLEDVALTPGMELQLSTTQAIRPGSAEAICQKLASPLLVCKGEEPLLREKPDDTDHDTGTCGGAPFGDRWFSAETTEDTVGAAEMADVTLRLPAIRRMKTGEEISVAKTPFKLGKSRRSADYAVNDPLISRLHARIDAEGDEYYITDSGSTNGTTLNGERLVPGKRVRLKDGDAFSLADEHFLFEGMAEKPRKNVGGGSMWIVRLSTGERTELGGERFSIGRGEGCSLVIKNERTISRNHAEILIRGGQAYIIDAGSTNSITVNGRLLEKDTEAELHDNDVISLGKEKFCFIYGAP